MAFLAQPCVGTNGSAVSNANATSGDQWDSVPGAGAGTTATYDSTHTFHGNPTSIKLHFAAVSSTEAAIWKAKILSAASNSYWRCYGYMTAYPSVAQQRISHMVNSAGLGAAVQITTGGKVRIIDQSGSTLKSSTASLPLNAPWRLEWSVTGITGSTGTVTAFMCSGANLETNTPDEAPLVATGAAVAGLIADARVGCSVPITESPAWDIWVGDVAWSDTGSPGPLNFQVTAADASIFDIDLASVAAGIPSGDTAAGVDSTPGLSGIAASIAGSETTGGADSASPAAQITAGEGGLGNTTEVAAVSVKILVTDTGGGFDLGSSSGATFVVTGDTAAAVDHAIATSVAAGYIKAWDPELGEWVSHPLRVWDGRAWIAREVKVWNGTNWEAYL